MDTECACVTKHVPKPAITMPYYILPLEDGGESEGSNVISLCPTTLFNANQLWELYDELNGRPDWNILREYSEYVRDLVERGRELRRRAT